MQCEDCKAAADLEALPGLAKVVHLLDPDRQHALDGHQRCRERAALATVNVQIETGNAYVHANTCTCQHGDNGRYQPERRSR